jgi:hypothetical protein
MLNPCAELVSVLVQHLVLSLGEILKRVQDDSLREFEYFLLEFISQTYFR